MELPARCGISIDNGADAVREASTAELLHWLRGKGVPEARLLEVQQLDQSLQGFRRDVLRYGLLKALIDKGHGVPRDATAWAVFEAAMQAKLQG